MHRLDGWERRLDEVFTSFEGEPYVLGTHDCFRVACRAVEALTGIDLWAEWAGRYATQQEGLRLIVEYGGDFDGAFSRLFGVEPTGALFARRGDILKFVSDDVPHLGVCRGREVSVLGENGTALVSLHACEHAWMIG